LEQQTSQYEAMLLKDDAAFSKYLDRAMDSDEKRGRRPPQR
jgi:ActR/RegA family two-component response regulator